MVWLTVTDKLGRGLGATRTGQQSTSAVAIACAGKPVVVTSRG
jgi:hypothetical protein